MTKEAQGKAIATTPPLRSPLRQQCSNANASGSDFPELSNQKRLNKKI